MGLSTKTIRRLGLRSTHLPHSKAFYKGPRRQRMKSFPTEERAREWAKEHGVAEPGYELREHVKGKKWQWHPIKERAQLAKR